MSDLTDHLIRSAAPLVTEIKQTLAGKHPGVQAVVLAELLALFVAAHAEQLRDAVLERHILAVRDLIPVVDKQLFGNAGHPGNSK